MQDVAAANQTAGVTLTTATTQAASGRRLADVAPTAVQVSVLVSVPAEQAAAAKAALQAAVDNGSFGSSLASAGKWTSGTLLIWFSLVHLLIGSRKGRVSLGQCKLQAV